MALPVFIHDVALTLFTLLSLNTTLIYMVHPPFNSKNLVTILTSLRFHYTSVFVSTKHCCEGGIVTIFTFYLDMSFLLVLLFI